VNLTFGNANRELKISNLLKASNIRKKKGGSVFDVFQFLLILVFQHCNLYHFLNSKKQDTAFSKNTYDRFLNESRYNWKRFLTLLATRVTIYFNSLTRTDRVISLVLDDSVIPRVKLSILVSMSFGRKYLPYKPTGVQRPYADRGGGAGSPPLYVPYAAAFWD